MIDIETLKIFGAGLISAAVPMLLYIRTRYSNEEVKDIFLSIYAATQEASDGGSEITDGEALEIIEDIVVAYVD
jgi:hypothetical protein